jgi:hypothetical protein
MQTLLVLTFVTFLTVLQVAQHDMCCRGRCRLCNIFADHFTVSFQLALVKIVIIVDLTTTTTLVSSFSRLPKRAPMPLVLMATTKAVAE